MIAFQSWTTSARAAAGVTSSVAAHAAEAIRRFIRVPPPRRIGIDARWILGKTWEFYGILAAGRCILADILDETVRWRPTRPIRDRWRARWRWRRRRLPGSRPAVAS